MDRLFERSVVVLTATLTPAAALAQEAARHPESSNLPILLFWLVVFGLLAVFVAGLAKKVVIFYDMADLVLTFTPWVAIFLLCLMLATLNEKGVAFKVVRMATLVIPILLAVAVVFNSVKYNKSLIVGLVVGPFKLLFATIGILALVNLIETASSDKSSYKDFTVAAIVFGITGWIAKRLINGEEVYAAKGWPLPNETQEE